MYTWSLLYVIFPNCLHHFWHHFHHGFGIRLLSQCMHEATFHSHWCGLPTPWIKSWRNLSRKSACRPCITLAPYTWKNQLQKLRQMQPDLKHVSYCRKYSAFGSPSQWQYCIITHWVQVDVAPNGLIMNLLHSLMSAIDVKAIARVWKHVFPFRTYMCIYIITYCYISLLHVAIIANMHIVVDTLDKLSLITIPAGAY